MCLCVQYKTWHKSFPNSVENKLMYQKTHIKLIYFLTLDY